MPEDRTTPMQTPPGVKPRRDAAQPGEETIAGGSDRDSGMAPTINVPPGQGPGPSFVRATPYDPPTPPPQWNSGGAPLQRPPAPFGPPGLAPAGGPGPAPDQTMLIKERVPPVFAWLVVVDGPDRASIGKVHDLRPDTVVGRAPGNQVVLVDETCSSQHFRIRVEAQEGGEPAFMLYDMGSRNGTFVGDRTTYRNPESQAYRYKLEDGDYLLVGETTLVFKKI
jgi:hypothetical protein